MQLRELAEMYAVESTHWWYAGMRRIAAGWVLWPRRAGAQVAGVTMRPGDG